MAVIYYVHWQNTLESTTASGTGSLSPPELPASGLYALALAPSPDTLQLEVESTSPPKPITDRRKCHAYIQISGVPTVIDIMMPVPVVR